MTVSINITGHTVGRRVLAPKFSVSAMFAVWKERRELSQLDENRLRDLGITPIEAAIETARPFWDLPKCPR